MGWLNRIKNNLIDWVKFQRYYGMQTFLRNANRDNIPASLKHKLEQAQKRFHTIDNVFSKPLNIVMVSDYLPRFDKTSADYRIYNIITILLANNCRIFYLYGTKTHKDQQYRKAFNGNISFHDHGINVKTCLDLIAQNNCDHIWITSLWRLRYVEFAASLLNGLKRWQLDATITVDTMDFHAKEYFRKYDWTKSEDDLTRAQRFLALEKKIYPQANVVVVISKEESEDIRKEIPKIKSIKTIPNIHENFRFSRPYDKRSNICFVGHFGNQHNVDAVTYFLEKIFTNILKEIPNEEFHVIGYGSERLKETFQGRNVRVIGSVKHIKEALARYKLFVCPMIYGAGMKGKIGLAIEAGTPVVTTTIGAEGFPVVNGQHCFVSDEPDRFAKDCVRCLSEPETWYRLSVNATVMAAENYSPGIVAQKLHSLLSHDK